MRLSPKPPRFTRGAGPLRLKGGGGGGGPPPPPIRALSLVQLGAIDCEIWTPLLVASSVGVTDLPCSMNQLSLSLVYVETIYLLLTLKNIRDP